jgi:hypothetical protein
MTAVLLRANDFLRLQVALRQEGGWKWGGRRYIVFAVGRASEFRNVFSKCESAFQRFEKLITDNNNNNVPAV